MTKDQVDHWINRNNTYTSEFEQKFSNEQALDLNDFKVKLSLDIDEFIKQNDCSKFHTTMWKEHLEHIVFLFKKNPHMLLCDDLVRYAIYLTAGCEFAKTQIPYLEARVGKNDLKGLLIENPAYKQTIVSSEYLTSESRINHLTHLKYLEEKTGIMLSDQKVFIEFGGGYGSMTDLIKRINPCMTQLVIDFPIMLLIQCYYLQTRYEVTELNIIRSANDRICEGKINLIPVNLAGEMGIEHLYPDVFLATFSLSESNNFTLTRFVDQLKLFQAKNILYGYRRYESVNPRQPCSSELQLSSNYQIVENNASFWTLSNDIYYQIAIRL